MNYKEYTSKIITRLEKANYIQISNNSWGEYSFMKPGYYVRIKIYYNIRKKTWRLLYVNRKH